MLPQHQQDTCRDRIFKLSPIHGSVIFRFPEFPEFSESSALFRKIPMIPFRLDLCTLPLNLFRDWKFHSRCDNVSCLGWAGAGARPGSPCLIFGGASGWGWNWGPWGPVQWGPMQHWVMFTWESPMWTDRQTQVKTLPSRNFIGGR